MKKRDVRGQAMVELVLGCLIFVTTLVFGLYVGEMGYLMAKVHEAGAYGMWESTAYQTYTYSAPGTGNTTAAASQAGSYANSQYQDFNGVTGSAGAAPTLVFAQATGINVACTPDPTTSYPWGGVIMPLTNYMTMTDTGGISCTATATIQPTASLPVNFLENTIGGTFHEANYIGPALTTVCANGYPGGGGCANNKMSILLGDYGMNNGNGWADADECFLSAVGGDNGGNCTGASNGSANTAFYNMTKQMWDASMQSQGFGQGWTGAPEAFVCGFTPGCPGGGVTDFYMSFRGSESLGNPFTETNLSDGTRFETNPMDQSAFPGSPAGRYRNAFNARLNCQSSSQKAAGPYPYCYLGKFPCD